MVAGKYTSTRTYLHVGHGRIHLGEDLFGLLGKRLEEELELLVVVHSARAAERGRGEVHCGEIFVCGV
jgi:hypothetical protein